MKVTVNQDNTIQLEEVFNSIVLKTKDGEEILKCEATEPSDTDWDECGSTAQYYWPQKKVDAGKFWGDVKTELQSF